MKVLKIIALVVLFFTYNLNAQFSADYTSNRKLGLLNDAGAVAWNPAMLGVISGVDVMGAVPLDASFGKVQGYAGFIKIGNYAFGLEKPSDNISISNSASAYAGLGLPIQTDHLWIGGSIRYSESTSNSLRFSASALFSPSIDLFASLGIDNTSTPLPSQHIITAMGAFSPLHWLTVHARLQYCADSALFFGNAINTEFGASANLIQEHIISSITINPLRNILRIGAEITLGFVSTGIIPSIGSGVDEQSASTALFRLNFSKMPSISALKQKDITLSEVRSVDAMCTSSAFEWLSTYSESPEYIVNAMKNHGGEYTAMADTLTQLSQNPAFLYDSIFHKIYAKYQRNSLVSGASQYIIAAKNPELKILVTKPDSMHNQDILMSIKILNDKGNQVQGILQSDLMIKEKKYEILSIEEKKEDIIVPIDYVIVMDCSGSMSKKIREVRKNVELFAKTLKTAGIDFRIGGILYGEEIISSLQPTRDIQEFLTFFEDADAIGNDEITSTAIMKATEMQFRSNAKRNIIVLTDDCCIQDNAHLSEIQVLSALWNHGCRLYSLINKENNNSGIITRLSLGKEYSINQPFIDVLKDVSKEQDIHYLVRLRAVPREVYVKGTVVNESGSLIQGSVSVQGLQQQLTMNQGEFIIEATHLSTLELTLHSKGYESKQCSIPIIRQGESDTILVEYSLVPLGKYIKGQILDQNKQAHSGTILIENDLDLRVISNTNTDNQGSYFYRIPDKGTYRMTPNIPNFIAHPFVISALEVQRGDTLQKDLMISSIEQATESGTRFSLKNIFFESKQWSLKTESTLELEKLLAFMVDNPSISIEISAHTDAIGKTNDNALLSSKRAEAVVEYLVHRGISKQRLNAIGYGESTPIASNDDENGREKNRRVEFTLIKK
jgi:outer membrane protein OmpA-like peptidoglycan-associated protein